MLCAQQTVSKGMDERTNELLFHGRCSLHSSVRLGSSARGSHAAQPCPGDPHLLEMSRPVSKRALRGQPPLAFLDPAAFSPTALCQSNAVQVFVFTCPVISSLSSTDLFHKCRCQIGRTLRSFLNATPPNSGLQNSRHYDVNVNEQ